MTGYRLIEIHADGWREEETFHAPDDETAWSRVLEAAEGEVLELWRGEHLIRMKDSRPKAGGGRPSRPPAPT